MQSLMRLRVFLVCCLLMIGMNVLLVTGGFIEAAVPAGEVVTLGECQNLLVAPAIPDRRAD